MVRIALDRCRITAQDGTSLDARFPTTMLTELVRAGIVPDPDLGTNARSLFGSRRGGCDFTAEITADEKTASCQNAVLCLSGILGKAEILFDGVTVGSCDSFGAELKIDVKPYLTVGTHALCIRFPSQVGMGHCPEALTDGTFFPPVFDLGVTGRAELICFRDAVIDGIRTKQTHRGGHVTLSIEVSTLGTCENVKAIASLTSPAGRIYYSGLSGGHGTVVVSDPEYWMPKSLGAPSLYRLGVTLYADDDVADETSVPVGLCEIGATGFGRAGKEPYGLSLCGVPFSFVGTDYVGESVLPVFDPAKAEKAVRDAAAAGISLLRFPPSAGYPREEVLSLCDRFGVCAYIALPKPWQNDKEAYLSELKRHLRGFAAHPSVTLISAGGAYDRDVFREVQTEAPGIPFAFLNYRDRDGTAVVTETDSRGTETVVPGFAVYRPIPSFPTYAGLQSAIPEEEQNPFSPTMDYRNPCGSDGQANLFTELVRRYLAPYTAEQTCYVSGIQTADEFARAYAASRTENKSGFGFLFSLIRDPWVAVSPALTDGVGNRRALYFAVKRALGGIALYEKRDGWRIGFTVENRRLSSFVGTVVCTVADAGNHVISQKEIPVEVPPMSVGQTETADFSVTVFGKETEYYVTAEVRDPAAVCGTLTLFCEPKAFRFRRPTVTVTVTGRGREFDLAVVSDSFVMNAELSVSGMTADFDENVFSLTKDSPHLVHLTTAEPATAQSLSERLSLTTMYDVGRPQKSILKVHY